MSFDVPHLLSAAGGQIVGKVRLQKLVYLLDQLGMRSGFAFEYHHYGPYSEELADAVDDCIAFGRISEKIERRASDGVPYSIFHAPAQASVKRLGDIRLDVAQTALAKMNEHSATVLELAATIHWLACVEEDHDWQTELRRRKGVKAAGGRTEEALKLLHDLGLPPA